MSFEVYVDGDYVLDGTGEGAVSGTFTMPDLGDDEWTVGVAAVVWDSDRRRKIERSLGYLGQALPPARPPVPMAPSAAPAVAPQGSSSPAPSSSPASAGRDFGHTRGAVVQSRVAPEPHAAGDRAGPARLEAGRAP